MSLLRAPLTFEIRRVPWGLEYTYHLFVGSPEESEYEILINLTPPSPTPSATEALSRVATLFQRLLTR